MPASRRLGTYQYDVDKHVNPAWQATDDYLEELFVKSQSDKGLEQALKSHETHDIPAINVSPLQGQFLHNLALSKGLSAPLNVLEIGTLAGCKPLARAVRVIADITPDSTIWLAKAAKASGGKVTTLEYSPKHAKVAAANIEAAGLSDVVEIIQGDAHKNLPELVKTGQNFDLVFIDADKPGYSDYWTQTLKMANKGAIIVADNVIRQGGIADPDNQNDNVIGVRAFLELVASDPRVSTSVVQTVNGKGWDGFTMSVVL